MPSIRSYWLKLNKNTTFWYFVAFFVLILTLVLVISLVWSGRRQPAIYQEEPEVQPVASGKPTFISIGNITGEQTAINFFTQKSGNACVYLVQDGQPTQRFTDDRGADITSNYHAVTLKQLSAETDYQIKLCTNYNCDVNQNTDWYGVQPGAVKGPNPTQLAGAKITAGGEPIPLKTGSALNIGGQPLQLVYGTISSGGKPGLILINAQNIQERQASGQLVTYFDPDTGFSIDLSNFRNADWQGFFDVNDSTSLTFTFLLTSGTKTTQTFNYQDIRDQPMDINI